MVVVFISLVLFSTPLSLLLEGLSLSLLALAALSLEIRSDDSNSPSRFKVRD